MRKLAATAAFATAVVGVQRYRSLRPALADVAADLRSPLLMVFGGGSFTARTLPLVRWFLRRSLSPGPGVTAVWHTIDGEARVRVLVVSPKDADGSRPALLLLHSGGMVVGSPQLEAPTMGRLARELAAVVVSPDYRLAPEHPFPAASDDCIATLRWMRSRAGELGIDPERIAVAGASAGGGFTATTAQRAYDEGIPLRAQAIVYGVLDDRTALVADHAGRGRFIYTPASIRFGWRAYLGFEPDSTKAPPTYAAAARRTDLGGLAPAWVGVGELDALYTENVAYAERLRDAGVPTELVTVPGMYHGADGMAAKAPAMQDFTRSMLEHLRAHL
jgi:acetyl esterase/lipase